MKGMEGGPRRWFQKDVRPDAKTEGEHEPKWVSLPVQVKGIPAEYGMLRAHINQLESPEDFKKVYPEVVSQKSDPDSNTFEFGEITIFSLSSTGEGYVSKDESPIQGGAKMYQDVKNAFHALAQEMQKDSSFLKHVTHLFGSSRLSNAAAYFGFDVFPFSQGERNEVHVSQELARKAYERSGMESEAAQKMSRKRPPALAIISREKFIELYGNNDK